MTRSPRGGVPEESPPGLRYTTFVLRLIWVAVVVPFVAGAALAFVLNLPERPLRIRHVAGANRAHLAHDTSRQDDSKDDPRDHGFHHRYSHHSHGYGYLDRFTVLTVERTDRARPSPFQTKNHKIQKIRNLSDAQTLRQEAS